MQTEPGALDDSPYLEPAHDHDPTVLPLLSVIPSLLMERLADDASTSLSAILDSTSILFASHTRLQSLAKARFNRLIPSKDQDVLNGITYSEPAFFNYVNQLRAEKEYFLEEAFLDWRHKALRVRFDNLHSVPFQPANDASAKETTLQKWWAELKSTVEDWAEEVDDTEIPDFDETVTEFRIFQGRELRRMEKKQERSRRKKTMLDLERPEFGGNGKLSLEKVDSGLGL